MTLPDIDEVLGYFDTLSNWGRWGDDDRLGTLNYVTPDVTRAAASEIREGVSVSCAWDIDNRVQEGDIYGPPQRYMINHGQGLGDEHRVLPRHRRAADRSSGVAEYVGFAFHGMNITHIDALVAHLLGPPHVQRRARRTCHLACRRRLAGRHRRAQRHHVAGGSARHSAGRRW